MAASLLRRVGLGICVLFVLTFASFCLFATQAGQLAIPSGQPVLTEYWTWLTGLFDGSSFHLLTQPAPTSGLEQVTMLEALGHTAALMIAALFLVTVLSVALAVAAAMWRGSPVDALLRGFSYLAWAVPAFLLAMILQKAIYSLGSTYGAGPFPIAGWPGACPAGLGIDAGTLPHCPAAGTGGDYVVGVLRHITLPALVLAMGFVGLHGRHLRSSLLGALDAPFITTARAKGLSERRVVLRHALRASLVTFVAVVLADFGAIFGAAMAVDWVFELNGLGTVLVREFPLDGAAPINLYSVQLVLLITGALILASSYLSELSVGWLDPRMRIET